MTQPRRGPLAAGELGLAVGREHVHVLLADQVMNAIQELSGQEYVHMFASDRKAELQAASQA